MATVEHAPSPAPSPSGSRGIDPYRSGYYAPVADELDVAELPVIGTIPHSLDGAYVRNGPNAMFEPKGRYHVFDGDGMLHAVYLRDGTARYRNRWIRTEGLAAEVRAGRALYGGMANADFANLDDPDDPVRRAAGPAMKNVANTNVIRHGGRTLCLWEAGLPTEVTWELDTVGLHDFGGGYHGTFSAHPKSDPTTGALITFGYGLDLGYREISAAGAVTHSVQIPLPAPVMMHDFAITASRAVFLDAPAVFDFAAFAAGGPMLRWAPEFGTRLGVLPRGGDASQIVWIETDNCYVFHFMNAWDDGDTILLHGARLASMDIGLDEGTTADAGGTLHRWTIDLTARSASCERIGELPGDFPRVDPRREGLHHRYGYVATFSSGAATMGEFDAVTKHDVLAGSQHTHRYGPNHLAGEAVFVPDPERDGEDEGWLLNFVTDRTDLTSELVILDAATLDTVARVPLPRRVPFGFHGNWFERPAG
jgi:carotenoid cleavage dioxygenase